MRDVYKTKDGRALFEFNFVDVGPNYEIDIVSSPSYGSRSSGQHPTHRLSSKRGGYRICVGNDRAVNSIKTAKQIAAAWAEQSWRYIKTGQPFAGS